MGFWDCEAELLGTTDGVSENDFGTHARTIVRTGSLPELVAFAMSLPEGQRARLSIVKPGNAFVGRDEIEKLIARPDYPGAKPR